MSVYIMVEEINDYTEFLEERTKAFITVLK